MSILKTLAIMALLGLFALAAATTLKPAPREPGLSNTMELFPSSPGSPVFLVPAATTVAFPGDEQDIDPML